MRPSRPGHVPAGRRPLGYHLGSRLQRLESSARWRLDRFEMAAPPPRAASGGPTVLGVLGCPCAFIIPNSLGDCAGFSRVMRQTSWRYFCAFCASSRLFAFISGWPLFSPVPMACSAGLTLHFPLDSMAQMPGGTLSRLAFRVRTARKRHMQGGCLLGFDLRFYETRN